MLGTIINMVAVIVGSLIGLVFDKGIPERLSSTLMQALGLCTVLIGVQGAIKGENALIMIASIVLGVLIGELLDLDEKLNRNVRKLESKFIKQKTEKSLAEGFISASLVFCVGSMAIVGCLNAGLEQDYSMLITKSMLDFTSSIIFASTLGAGVIGSAFAIFVYQGSLTLLASVVAPILSQTVIAEMSCVGSLLIIAIGLNLMGLTKIKVMNYLPAMFMPIILCMFM